MTSWSGKRPVYLQERDHTKRDVWRSGFVPHSKSTFFNPDYIKNRQDDEATFFRQDVDATIFRQDVDATMKLPTKEI